MSWAMQHLRLRLRPILRVLGAAAARQAAEVQRLARTEPVCITPAQVAGWCASLDAALLGGRASGERAALTSEEESDEARIRANAADDGVRLPLDVVIDDAELEPFEVEALLVGAGVELDARWGGILAFIADDVTRVRPTIGLLASLTATALAQFPARRRALGRLGRLRRTGLLRAHGESPVEHDQELVLGPRVLDALLGLEPPRFADPLEIVPGTVELPPDVDTARVNTLVAKLRDRTLAVVGVWGPRVASHAEVARALGAGLHTRLRRLPRLDGADAAERLREVVADAEALNALLWIECDRLESASLCDELAAALARSSARGCLTGERPLRLPSLLSARNYAELTLAAPTYAARRDAWSAALPEVAASELADLAARYRFDRPALTAVARMARTAAKVASNGHVASPADFVEPACAALVRKRTHHFARVTTPRRGPHDLVLAPALHRQVLEIADAFRAWPRVADAWGLGRVASGGLKALFTGEPGTGKTLAAEVIAAQIGLPLVRIDLAQVVSKWIGETEKNLDVVFRETDDGNAVLFFDEADALFGKRGDVRHGTDRYANLEVSFLLQRLEEHEGLVILASNLKDEIDGAFTRRFHAVIHFPRPAEAERRRLWRLALPASAPVDAAIDLASLAKLDLTGAGIVAAARTAALHAAQTGAARIGAVDLVFGVARQFQREARLLTGTDLGPYAAYLPRTS
jgi:ATPase family protein associated with various cellular activities (AAA)/winged helix domain-containing protein